MSLVHTPRGSRIPLCDLCLKRSDLLAAIARPKPASVSGRRSDTGDDGKTALRLPEFLQCVVYQLVITIEATKSS